MSRARDGSTTVVALMLLILMASAAAGCAIFLQTAFTCAQRSADRNQLRRLLRREGERIITCLANDPTPDSDSPLDPVWTEITRPESPGLVVALQDISSRLNANWIQKAILEETALCQLLRSGFTARDLQQRREEQGISTDIAAAYGDLIKDDALPRYFTGYGYANLNTTDEFALRKLYAARMGDPSAAEAFRARWQQAIIRKKTLRRDDLREFLGLDYQELFPVVNVEPSFNVHFLDQLVLSELLSFPDFKISEAKKAARLVLDARDREELTAEKLRRMIGAPTENSIYQYLGVITWFWKVIVARNDRRMELIVARVPSEDGSAPRFQIIEERYFP